MNNMNKYEKILGNTRLFLHFLLILCQLIFTSRDFKEKSNVDQVIVLWTANTERFSEIKTGLNTTMLELEQSLAENKSEISPSTIFAMASIAEQVYLLIGFEIINSA